MYAKTEETLKKAVSDMHKEKTNYPAFTKRFEKFYQRGDEWLLFCRKDLLTRQNNTNNFAEATMRILKDIILSRTKAFNVVALADFCVTMWEPYLKKKLLEFAHYRKGNVQLLFEQFQRKTQNLLPKHIDMINPDLYSIQSNNNTYFIDTNVGCCSCPSGTSGAFCKHQFFLMKEKNVKFFHAPPVFDSDKYELAVIALGEKCPPSSFFQSFKKVESEVLYSHEVDPSIESANSPVTEEIVTEKQDQMASQCEKERVKKEIIRLTNLLENNITKNSTDRLLHTFQQIQTVNDFDKLYFLRSKVQKKIRVQPTSIARRRPGLTKSGSRVVSGRPSVLSKKCLKRKRSLKENVERNLPNAKSHSSFA